MRRVERIQAVCDPDRGHCVFLQKLIQKALLPRTIATIKIKDVILAGRNVFNLVKHKEGVFAFSQDSLRQAIGGQTVLAANLFAARPFNSNFKEFKLCKNLHIYNW